LVVVVMEGEVTAEVVMVAVMEAGEVMVEADMEAGEDMEDEVGAVVEVGVEGGEEVGDLVGAVHGLDGGTTIPTILTCHW
jgi:hypothetical protein